MSLHTPQQQIEELARVFLQRAPTGQQRFTNAEIRHFLPLAVLSIGYDGKGGPQLAPLMNGFFAKLNLPVKADNATIAKAVHAYYRRYPANRELERQFFAYCRSQANGELDPAQARKYAKAVTAAPAKTRPQAAMRPPVPQPVAKPGIFNAIGRFLKGPD